MKVAVAAFAGALAAAFVGATTAKEEPVVGYAYATKQLAWFDRATLRPLARPKLGLREGVCTSSFSPDRTRLAVSSCSGQLTFVDVRKMKRVGDMFVTSELGTANMVAWLRPDRLLATGSRDSDGGVVVIDPTRRRVIRHVPLPGPASGLTVLPGGRVAFLVGNAGSFGPARVMVANADGDLRVATLGRISTGSVFQEGGDGYSGTTRGVGFAVDVAGGRAFVVDPDLVVGEVDLGSLEVAYHGPVRTLSKVIDGSVRQAAWLGNGVMAVAGGDFSTTGTGSGRRTTVTPFGLRLVDTSTWEARMLDPHAQSFQRLGDVLLVETPAPGSTRTVTAWNLDAAVQYTVKVPPLGYLNTGAAEGYICKSTSLLRVVSAATGKTVAAPPGRSCVRLLGDSGTQ